MAKREQWGSRIGFLLSAVGSAVGLGNIWRFPYQAYENGGGAFLIPYFIAALTAGIPLVLFEFSLGHRMRASLPTIFRRLSKRNGYRNWEWIGWFQALLAIFIAAFYAVILSWVFYYIGLSFTGGWGDNSETFFFNDFLNVSASPFEFGSVNVIVLALTACVWFVSWLIVFRGIKSGVEIAGKIFMPLLAVMMVILMFHQVTLPGAAAGLNALFEPDFQKLTDINIWISAYGQVFFSMSLGVGAMITYASYLPKESDVTNNAFLTGLLDTAFSLISGIMIFATLGAMAAAQGVTVQDVVQGGPALTFVTVPEALNGMSGARIFGPLFFLSLSIAGMTSIISLLEPLTAAMTERLKISRRKSVSVICAAGFLLSILYTFRSGLLTLDIADYFSGNFGMLAGGLCELILVCWILKPDFLSDHANRTSDFKIGSVWKFCISALTPLVLIVMLSTNIAGLFSSSLPNYGGYSSAALFVFGWMMMALLVLFAAIARKFSTERAKETILHIWEEFSNDKGGKS